MQSLFKKILPAASLCMALLSPLSAGAQTTDSSLFQHLGQKPGVERLMNDFVERLAADPRTAPFFAKANLQHLKEQLTDQICHVSGGPCQYEGADMKTAHAEMDIRKGDFNALVDVLEKTMDAQGIAFSDQRDLLARLAPMHRDVITVR